MKHEDMRQYQEGLKEDQYSLRLQKAQDTREMHLAAVEKFDATIERFQLTTGGSNRKLKDYNQMV